MPRHVLFLCTANYYRSRFAELLFNHLARQSDLDWVARSAAVAIEQGACNIGPISPHTRDACRKRGIALPDRLPIPRAAALDDFDSADLVIALKEAEHRPYVESRYADRAHRVEYWHVHDLDGCTAEQACAEIERNVTQLVSELARHAVR